MLLPSNYKDRHKVLLDLKHIFVVRRWKKYQVCIWYDMQGITRCHKEGMEGSK